MSVATVNGQDLHYDEIDVSGDPGSPAVVWIHGFLFSASLYRPVIDRMPGYRHVAVDLRGHGRSAGVTDDVTLSRMADDTWELLCQLGIERFVCVGHSTGNAVGMRLVSRHPAAVIAGVSLAGVSVFGMPDSTRAAVGAIPESCGDLEAFVDMLGAMFVHEDMTSLVRECAESAVVVQHDPLVSISRIENYLNESADILPGLTQPWLFFVPSEDVAVPPDSQLATVEAVSGSRAILLAGEGHIFPQERPAETATWIEAFLATLLPAR